MGAQRSLGFDDIGTAWRFVEECEDDEPGVWGHELVLGRATLDADGVYREHAVSPGVDYSSLTSRRVLRPEDAVIARIDRARRKRESH
ncbi:MAG: hypothetical protein R3A48_27565 [Polyangiales bacterium]